MITRAKKRLFNRSDEEKLLLGLLTKYSVQQTDPSKWRKLAIKLAIKHKEFKTPKSKTVIWNESRYRKLGHAYFTLKLKHPKLSDGKLIAMLNEQRPWKNQHITAQALQNRFCEVKHMPFWPDFARRFKKWQSQP